MSRPKMFIPKNFTVAPNTRIYMEDTAIIEHDSILSYVSVNRYAELLSGDLDWSGWDVYIESTRNEFFERMDAIFTEQKYEEEV